GSEGVQAEGRLEAGIGLAVAVDEDLCRHPFRGGLDDDFTLTLDFPRQVHADGKWTVTIDGRDGEVILSIARRPQGQFAWYTDRPFQSGQGRLRPLVLDADPVSGQGRVEVLDSESPRLPLESQDVPVRLPAGDDQLAFQGTMLGGADRRLVWARR